jgi:hypothetical protein
MMLLFTHSVFELVVVVIIKILVSFFKSTARKILAIVCIWRISGKLSEKIATWFSPSSGTGATSKDDRRNSEGGKSGSSFASKIRKSFRRRSRTISAGQSCKNINFCLCTYKNRIFLSKFI